MQTSHAKARCDMRTPGLSKARSSVYAGVGPCRRYCALRCRYILDARSQVHRQPSRVWEVSPSFRAHHRSRSLLERLHSIESADTRSTGGYSLLCRERLPSVFREKYGIAATTAMAPYYTWLGSSLCIGNGPSSTARTTATRFGCRHSSACDMYPCVVHRGSFAA